MRALGIDPGLTGGIVVLNDEQFDYWVMPTKEKDVDFDQFLSILNKIPDPCQIFLERALPLAMGSKHAFNYGRNFMALEIAIKFSKKPVVYIEPAKWTKVMHEGISKDLKPKAKSVIAAERLFPVQSKKIPTSKNGKIHEGILDALLIAGYGKRTFSIN